MVAKNTQIHKEKKSRRGIAKNFSFIVLSGILLLCIASGLLYWNGRNINNPELVPPPDHEITQDLIIERVSLTPNVSLVPEVYVLDTPDNEGRYEVKLVAKVASSAVTQATAEEIRNTVRNVLFEKYGTYPYLAVEITLEATAGVKSITYSWNSDTELWDSRNSNALTSEQNNLAMSFLTLLCCVIPLILLFVFLWFLYRLATRRQYVDVVVRHVYEKE